MVLAKQLYFTGDEFVLIIVYEHSLFLFLLKLHVPFVLEDIKVFNILIASFLSIMMVEVVFNNIWNILDQPNHNKVIIV